MPVLPLKWSQWLRRDASRSERGWWRPVSANARVVWMIVVCVSITTWLQFLPRSFAAGPAPAALAAMHGRDGALPDGRGVYVVACAMCHGQDGKGALPNGPALDGALWLTRCTTDQLVAVVLDGVHGPIAGSPAPYAVMPSLRAWLTDDQVAAVSSYVLRVHGARQDQVPQGQVRLIRDRSSTRQLPWSLDELGRLPVTESPTLVLP